MRPVIATLCLLLFVSLASAQDRVPQEAAERYAKLFVQEAAKADKAPLQVDADADKPYAFRAEGRAAMIIPDKKLTADAIAKAGKEVVPVGQLWLLQLSPAIAGKATPNDKLRLIKIAVENEERQLPLCLLGVRKNAKDELELVVYAKDKEPLLSVPLQKADSRQELPIELEAKKGDKDTGLITLNILGKYKAVLTVAEKAP